MISDGTSNILDYLPYTNNVVFLVFNFSQFQISMLNLFKALYLNQ